MFFMIKCRVYIFGKNASEEMFSEHPVRRVMALIGHSSDGNVDHLSGVRVVISQVSLLSIFFFSFVISKYHVERILGESTQFCFSPSFKHVLILA